MTLISRSIPALYGGVSQQPDTLRSDHQLAAAVNSWSTIVDGIGKRPPSQHIAQLSDQQLADCRFHFINRDSTERYLVVILHGDIKVFGMDGLPRAVNFPYGRDYLYTLNSKSPRECFRACSVADYTFIVNTQRTVAQGVKDSDRATSPYNYFNPNRPPGATGAVYGAYAPNPPKGIVRGTVQTFQDLPATAAEGWLYAIRATNDSNFVGYYVRYTQGTWIEVTSNDVNNTLDATSMPWALVRQPDGVFEFAPFAWGPRRSGDAATNPGPSFLGRQIKDVFFAENRLGFLCDESIVMSRAGDYGMFWRMTVTQTLDDDFIDISATETKVTKMNAALPTAGTTMLFSDQTQFRMDKGSDGAMTPSSVSLTPVTHYPMAEDVAPEAIGSDAYFPSDQSGWTRLYRYFVSQGGANSTTADDVTAHVPRYIPGSVRDIAASADHDAVFVMSNQSWEKLFHYKFHWEGDQLAQSAWGYWELPYLERWCSVECFGSKLYAIIQRPTGTFLESFDLSSTASAPGLSHEVYLDRRKGLVGGYNANADMTIFDLPYAVTPDKRSSFQVVRGGALNGAGGLIDPSGYIWIDQYTLAVPGNAAALCYVGHAYNMSWTFSRWFMKNGQGQPDLSGRLQVRTVSLYYNRAGYFETAVAPYGTEPEVQVVAPALLDQFTGKTLGSTEARVGTPSFPSGVYSFQVFGNAEDAVITINNPSHLQAYFTSAEVEFFWQKRAQFR